MTVLVFCRECFVLEMSSVHRVCIVFLLSEFDVDSEETSSYIVNLVLSVDCKVILISLC